MKTETLLGMVVFIALVPIVGYLNAAIVDMLGLTGVLVTIMSTSLLFLVYAYLSKVRIEPAIYLVFFFIASGATVIASMLTNTLAVSDQLMQTIIQAATLYVGLFVLQMTPKQQQKTPQNPL